MKVTTPAGETVHVRRRWLPWRRRSDGTPVWDASSLDLAGDDIVSMIVIGLFALLVLPIVVGCCSSVSNSCCCSPSCLSSSLPASPSA